MKDLSKFNIRDWLGYLLPGTLVLFLIALALNHFDKDLSDVVKIFSQNDILRTVFTVAFVYVLGQIAILLGSGIVVR